jgi:hypothetical protein
VPVNRYFNNFNYGREQDLLEDLIIESIKMYGHEMKYLPRTLVEEDHLFGEAKLSMFEDSVPVEMYIKNVEGFEGEGDLLSKFGVEIRDQMTFTMARKRFDQIRGGESLQTEVGFQLQNETANTDSPSRQFLTDNADVHGVMLESGTEGANNYVITSNRPNEGDLIYFPLTDKLFEIKFVEHEEVFYQMGRLQTYDLRCELFQYSSERIDTGDSDVDSVEDQLSNDILFNEVTLEDGSGSVSYEDGDSMITEYRLEDTDDQANNEFFTQQALSGIIDFSETNPFSEIDRY